MSLHSWYKTVITRSNIVKYCINNYRNWGRIWIWCWIHKSSLTGELWGVFCEYWLCYNSIALQLVQALLAIYSGRELSCCDSVMAVNGTTGKPRDPIYHLPHWGGDKMAAIFADVIFKCIFLNENVWILIKISLNFVSKGSINHIQALV